MERVKLRGAGGEPVDFARTLLSHGVADLPPNTIERDGSALETVIAGAGGASVVRVVADGAASARVDAEPAGDFAPVIRHMLRLDDDLSTFYERAAEDPDLAWVTGGAGRMMRSPTVFEDLVKTICTTNCTWSATERMVGALVGELGDTGGGRARAADVPHPRPRWRRPATTSTRAWPRPATAVRTCARSPPTLAEGRLDLEALNDPALPDAEVTERLLALPGVGPYACAHVMMLLGRYRTLILDSWTRPTYRRLAGRPRVTDKGIEKAFRRYREYAGLAFWLMLTRDWVSDQGG